MEATGHPVAQHPDPADRATLYEGLPYPGLRGGVLICHLCGRRISGIVHSWSPPSGHTLSHYNGTRLFIHDRGALPPSSSWRSHRRGTESLDQAAIRAAPGGNHVWRPEELLDAAALSLTRELAQALTQDTGGVLPGDLLEALSVLATVHWLRYQLLPEGQDQDDLQACLYWSASLLPVAPHLVPEPVRARLTGRDYARRSDAEASARGTALYQDYQRTGNIQLLHTAITLFRDAVDGTPADHPDRTGRLANLGNALRTQFERTGQQADLEEAITLLAMRPTPPWLMTLPGPRVCTTSGLRC